MQEQSVLDKQKARKEYMKNYRLKNKYRLQKLHQEYYLKNKEKLKEDYRSYYIKNKASLREKGKLHYEQNKTAYLLYSKHRKKHILQATPGWLTEKDFDLISDIYEERRKLTEATGVMHHVDHVIPLRGDLVCGLHVPSNLRIVLADENLKKGARFDV